MLSGYVKTYGWGISYGQISCYPDQTLQHFPKVRAFVYAFFLFYYYKLLITVFA